MKYDKKLLRCYASQKEIDSLPIVGITQEELYDKMCEMGYNPAYVNENYYGLKMPEGVVGGNKKELYRVI